MIIYKGRKKTARKMKKICSRHGDTVFTLLSEHMKRESITLIFLKLFANYPKRAAYAKWLELKFKKCLSNFQTLNKLLI